MMIIDPNNSPVESNPTDAMSPDPSTETILSTGVPTPEFTDDWTNLDRIPAIITSDKPSILKRPVKPTATVLLIGETGTGKTTFMSLLVSLLQGKSLFELEDMHNESNESGLSKIQSQTTSAALYTVTTSDGFILNILDTPGLADTRGIDQDNKHKAEINRAIEEFVTSIDAVIIMANGTIQRLSAATAYTLNIITTIFPHSIVDNIGLMFTNSDSLSLNFQLESLPSELRQSPSWVIQNPLALIKNFRSEANRVVPQSVTRARERKLEASYWEAVNTLDEWLGWIDEREAKPTKEINDLYEKSIRIESRVGVALSHITSLAKKRNEWEQISAELNSTTASKDGIEASILQQQEAVVWELKESENYNLICMEEGCHSNCDCPSLKRIHKAKQWSYNWMFVPGVGASALTIGEIGWAAACGVGVAATAGGAALVGAALWLFSRPLGCEACHHSALQHRFYKLVHAKKPGHVDEETIRRFADAQTTEQKQQAAKEVVQEELDKIQSDMDETESVLRDLIDEFNQISLSGNFAGHVRSVIQILELRERELQSKTGADLELKLVRESITKLKEKMNFLEEQTGATVNGNWKTVTKAKGFSKTVLLDSGYE